MLRVLITVEPRMYRQALARSLHLKRPALDVRIAPPESIEGELASFRPHLLVRNDTDTVGAKELASVPFRVEVMYSDSMDAKIVLDGREERIKDASTDLLVLVADEAQRWLSAQDKAP